MQYLPGVALSFYWSVFPGVADLALMWTMFVSPISFIGVFPMVSNTL